MWPTPGSTGSSSARPWGCSLDHLFRLDQNYGCLNVIDYFPDMAVVRLINGGVNGVAPA